MRHGGQLQTQTPKSAFTYATDVDLDNANDSHSLVVSMVGENKRVLELGCAEGSTTRVLQARGCHVTGIEIDCEAAQVARNFADRVLVQDLDGAHFEAELAGERFDVVLSADVLEHLRDPGRCLRACSRLLKPGGEVVLSVPNVAHADVRLALLEGHFDYTDSGLLDDTHLRFFTRSSLRQLLEDCGLIELELQRVTRPIRGTEVTTISDPSPEVLARLRSDPESQTYQFVVRAAPEHAHIAQLARQRDALAQDVERLTQRVEALAQYRDAYCRLTHLVCPGLEEVDFAGPNGSPGKDAVAHVHKTLRALLEERDSLLWSSAQSAGVRQELMDVRASKTFMAGQLLLSPAVFAMRCASRIHRAWQLSKQ